MQLWAGVVEFIAVAESHSFTAAAKRLNTSTAHVSRQVSNLEERLAIKLLYRTTRKVSLTEEGTVYYHHCRLALDGLEEAERAVSSLNDKPRGIIRMTAPVTYGEQFIMPVIIEYMQQHPDIEVICNLTNQQIDLLEGSYDLAIRLGALPDSSMIARRLTSRTRFVCASPEYIERQGMPHTLSELGQHNCLVGNNSHWQFTENGKARSIRVHGSLTCSSGYTLLNAALKGIGLIQLPSYYVGDAIASGSLRKVLQQYQEPEENIWALYPQNRHLSPKVRRLVELLEQRLP
ncbi:LysR substrate-binding domain-containing protein [Spongorhabdus nitratireducens]